MAALNRQSLQARRNLESTPPRIRKTMATKKKTKKVKVLALHLGYVESSFNACAVLSHRKGFDTLDEAIADLAVVLRKAQLAMRETEYYREFANDRFDHFVFGWIQGDMQDGFSHEVWEHLDFSGWGFPLDSYGRKPATCTIYPFDSADRVLFEALPEELKLGEPSW
jgi:hypothetical protein